MSLMPSYFSTTRTSKRQPQRKSAKAIQMQREIDALLTKNGYTGRLGSRHRNEIPSYAVESNASMSNTICSGVAAKASVNVYSGERKLLGIATMHKSNMVPVFSSEEATEISRMRLG
jgi:hypothetical protein